MSATQSILDGYIREEQFALNEGISTRTSARYRAQANGLPFVEFGGKIYIPIEEARNWLRDRVKRPNRRRLAA
ncbi:hypothetical protein [Bradyrhizobium elkanii]|uniref:hypothetical protein n=1 Tax=Bradyrhizobium elkanii TaxID=29448 RepID=UPI002729AF95|nr:hypothetical protein [Bradyrhizobium elkanii]WLA79011.1 hypothetical protein QNJ99_26740 [Bradyrhizobium elkanii]